MPQELYVLRCFSCETFQAHIVKKAKKWQCKMCGAKQSVKRNYGKGSAKDCRNQVMRLNELRFMNDSRVNEIGENIHEDDLNLEQVNEELNQNRLSVSKWTDYLEEPEANTENEVVEENEPDFCVMVEKKTKKRRKMSENSNKKICRTSAVSEESSPVKTSHLSPSFSNGTSNGSVKTYKSTTKTNTIQTVTKLKVNKYAMYLDNEEKIDNGLLKVNKSSNIFDSGTNDLDNILSLE